MAYANGPTVSIVSCPVDSAGNMNLQFSASYPAPGGGPPNIVTFTKPIPANQVAAYLAFVGQVVKQAAFVDPATPTPTDSDVARLVAMCFAIDALAPGPSSPPQMLTPPPLTLTG